MKSLSKEIPESKKSDSSNKEIRLVLTLLITFIILLVELIGGLLSNSLALLADVGHMFQDVFSLLLAILALKISYKKRDSNYSFGYKRAEVLAALMNGLFLVIISIYLLIESFNRFGKPEVINTSLMFIVSLIGIVANIIMFLLLFNGSHEDLNVKGALLHVAGDTLGSIGALTASVLIILTGNVFFDILVTLLITFLIIISSINLLKQSIHILMEGVPENLDVELMNSDLLDIKGVKNIHDIHIWSTSSNDKFFSGHFVIEKEIESSSIMSKITECLNTNYNISHATIQIEHDSHVKNCVSCDS